jgi:hypothetical protein
MPTPNATLLVSVNGGAPATGGITAAAGDTVQFTFQNTTGWRNNCRLELSFPTGFSLPAGWSSETVGGHTVYYVLGNTTPPPITLGPWGKYMPKLIVNGGVATDESTAISVPSPGGLLDLGHREAGQFGGSAEKWAKDQRANLRVIEAGLGGGSGAVPPTPDTLLLRGSAGEGRVSRVELAGARILSGVPEQIGDLGIDTTTGEPHAYIDGRGVVALREWVVRVHRLQADAAASDAMPDVPICGPPGVPWTITAVRYIANEAVPAHADDYVQLSVRIYSSAGAGIGYPAIGNTKPSGTNSVGAMGGFAPWNLVLQAGLAFPIDSAHYAAFGVAKFGAGQILPAGVFEVVCRPWRDA